MKHIKGLKNLVVEQKILQYADDAPLFLAPEENSLRVCTQVLDKFHKITGTCINLQIDGMYM